MANGLPRGDGAKGPPRRGGMLPAARADAAASSCSSPAPSLPTSPPSPSPPNMVPIRPMRRQGRRPRPGVLPADCTAAPAPASITDGVRGSGSMLSGKNPRHHPRPSCQKPEAEGGEYPEGRARAACIARADHAMSMRASAVPLGARAAS
eukprot:CAMPEP_0198707172 /NCGR_PEP_ID=MMETSP1468-20131203/391343_1 /TAXON_ID=1461545 /ORGANISM="Mantoniella sp, Strain CCMP1436" /LENGTH=149 /DNA_ID=CAMNT_0044466135 /DNA_START=1145 /DNA_END=1596 /DNA_ORIENTATION=-